MGRIAGERCRLVIAADEDPRGEDRHAIIEEIVRGAESCGPPPGRRRPGDRRPARRHRRRLRPGPAGRPRPARGQGPRAHDPLRGPCPPVGRGHRRPRAARGDGLRRRLTVRGCLFTLLLGAIVLVFGVYVGLPAAASAVLTAGITGRGPPGGRHHGDGDQQAADGAPRAARRPGPGPGHPRDVPRASGSVALDVALGDVAIVDRTAGTVDGELTDVTVPDVGGRPLTLPAITLSGGGDERVATTTDPRRRGREPAGRRRRGRAGRPALRPSRSPPRTA